jgi:hypothetical protein
MTGVRLATMHSAALGEIMTIYAGSEFGRFYLRVDINAVSSGAAETAIELGYVPHMLLNNVTELPELGIRKAMTVKTIRSILWKHRTYRGSDILEDDELWE